MKRKTYGRPPGRKGGATNLYLPHDIKALASKVAFQRNQSLSQLIADLLRQELQVVGGK
jgi:hypothetical protein